MNVLRDKLTVMSMQFVLICRKASCATVVEGSLALDLQETVPVSSLSYPVHLQPTILHFPLPILLLSLALTPDIDECAGESVVACSPNEICRNIIGSFVCEPEPPSPAVPDSPVTPSDTPSEPSPSLPSSPITPASPDTPSDLPSVAPQPSEPTIEPSEEPVPPVPGLPDPEDDDCNLQCQHLNAECRRNGAEECVCRNGYVGDGVDCCILSSLLDILKRQQEMIGQEHHPLQNEEVLCVCVCVQMRVQKTTKKM